MTQAAPSDERERQVALRVADLAAGIEAGSAQPS